MRHGNLIKKMRNSATTVAWDPEVLSRIIDRLAEVVAQELAEDRAVQIRDFITLKPKDLAAKKGRNPRTGEEIDIPAKRTVGIKPAPAFEAKARWIA